MHLHCNATRSGRNDSFFISAIVHNVFVTNEMSIFIVTENPPNQKQILQPNGTLRFQVASVVWELFPSTRI